MPGLFGHFLASNLKIYLEREGALMATKCILDHLCIDMEAE
jgi:hypothetical protein